MSRPVNDEASLARDLGRPLSDGGGRYDGGGPLRDVSARDGAPRCEGGCLLGDLSLVEPALPSSRPRESPLTVEGALRDDVI